MAHDEYNDILDNIDSLSRASGSVQIMEVCGTHTVSLFRSGIKSLLPENVKLLSGPGCPVCVTSQGYIDTALELAGRPDTIICTYGDMIRVPGQTGSLERKRAEGADIRVVYSARDSISLAVENPEKDVVWLAVGFETTAPTTAAMLLETEQKKIGNLSILSGHKLAIPAMTALLSAGEVPIDGFLCPGHVSVIIGEDAYGPVIDFGKPCVIAGFEPKNMLEGIAALLTQIVEKRSEIENVYGVAVTAVGNSHALRYLEEVFDIRDTDWRAIGSLPASGLELNKRFMKYDALTKFSLEIGLDYDPPGCKCGEVIQGKVQPLECELFDTACSPSNPIGPCMVSSEGTCAAWYKYGRNLQNSRERV